MKVPACIRLTEHDFPDILLEKTAGDGVMIRQRRDSVVLRRADLETFIEALRSV